MKTFNEFLTEATKAPALDVVHFHTLISTKNTPAIVFYLADEWKIVNGTTGSIAFGQWARSVLSQINFKANDAVEYITKVSNQWSLK